MIKRKPYGISSELGEIETTTHKVETKGRVVYNSGEVFFEKTSSRERFKSNRYKELVLDFATDTSTRKASSRLNRIRLEKAGISPTTYRNMVEREGMSIQAHIETKCEEALIRNGFDNNGALLDPAAFTPVPQQHIDQAAIENAAINLNIWEYESSDYELPRESVNISIDDVGVKRQTEMRPKDAKQEQPKRVDNTIIHVQSGRKSYILNASSLFSCIKLLIGFLLCNGLSKKQIVIFADGARDIHNAVHKMLGFLNYKIILDWYHLKKKFKEQLSMALKGSKIRNEFLDVLLPCLWFGNVDGAIKLLQNIDSKKVKNPDYIKGLIDYLERVRRNIPCYALRKELGLRNSSNLGEKANDLVVSNRQKHNGMSWSNDGSLAFASVASASFNSEIHHWVHEHNINFLLIDLDDVA